MGGEGCLGETPFEESARMEVEVAGENVARRVIPERSSISPSTTLNALLDGHFRDIACPIHKIRGETG